MARRKFTREFKVSAVKLAIALQKTVSLKDITRYPVLADLAALIDGRAAADAGHAPGSGDGVAEVRTPFLTGLASPRPMLPTDRSRREPEQRLP